MRLRILAVALMLSQEAVAQGQSAPRRNGVDLEILGNGILASVNFDRMVTPTRVVRVGLAEWGVEGCVFCDVDEKTDFIGVPASVAHLSGTGTSHFEVGGGLLVGRFTHTVSPDTEEESTTSGTVLDLTGIIGYRYQTAGRFYWRFAFTPFLALVNAGANAPAQGFTPSLGTSFGVRF